MLTIGLPPLSDEITCVTYDRDLTDSDPRPAIFLAGPTTDGRPDGWMQVGDRTFSTWRALLCSALSIAGYKGTIIIPEFSAKRGDFDSRAHARWGRTQVPEGVPVRPRSWDVYHWEINHLNAADLCVAWMDCRDSGAGVGLNARPEIQGLLEREIARRGGRGDGARSRRLIFGIGPECTGKMRFEALAYEAGIKPARSIAELAAAVLNPALQVRS